MWGVTAKHSRLKQSVSKTPHNCCYTVSNNFSECFFWATRRWLLRLDFPNRVVGRMLCAITLRGRKHSRCWFFHFGLHILPRYAKQFKCSVGTWCPGETNGDELPRNCSKPVQNFRGLRKLFRILDCKNLAHTPSVPLRYSSVWVDSGQKDVGHGSTFSLKSLTANDEGRGRKTHRGKNIAHIEYWWRQVTHSQVEKSCCAMFTVSHCSPPSATTSVSKMLWPLWAQQATQLVRSLIRLARCHFGLLWAIGTIEKVLAKPSLNEKPRSLDHLQLLVESLPLSHLAICTGNDIICNV